MGDRRERGLQLLQVFVSRGHLIVSHPFPDLIFGEVAASVRVDQVKELHTRPQTKTGGSACCDWNSCGETKLRGLEQLRKHVQPLRRNEVHRTRTNLQQAQGSPDRVLDFHCTPRNSKSAHQLNTKHRVVC